jgi:S1-C subfamily serine protease
MNDQADFVAQFSTSLAARVDAAKGAIIAIRTGHNRHITGTLWQPDVVVTSEQSLPQKDEFEAVAAGGRVLTTTSAGRDPATNIAVLRLAEPIGHPSIIASEAPAGALTIAIGADGNGDATARLGVVNLNGAEWHSQYGGRIDRRVVLDLRLSPYEEGGPVFDHAEGYIGMSTFGIRGQVLVIPTATIERVVSLLMKDGRIARGWIGLSLQRVAIPEALRQSANHKSGLMVMSVVEDGPAAKAGIVPGDIIVSVDGISTHRFRTIARHFGPDSIGTNAEIRLIRGGAIIDVKPLIEERPPA